MGDQAAVTTTIEDGVAVVRFDDGKANVLSPDAITALGVAFDQAEAQARAVCLVGRPGKLCAGFDLSIMQAGDASKRLVASGGELLMRVFVHPQPVVVAVTGHALAARGLELLACDLRIAADVPAKIGLNETAIGMPLPQFALELAQDRLDRRRITEATVGAASTTPPRPPRPATSTGSCPSTSWRPPLSPRPAGWGSSTPPPTPRPSGRCASRSSTAPSRGRPPTWSASSSSPPRRPAVGVVRVAADALDYDEG